MVSSPAGAASRGVAQLEQVELAMAGQASRCTRQCVRCAGMGSAGQGSFALLDNGYSFNTSVALRSASASVLTYGRLAALHLVTPTSNLLPQAGQT